MTLKISQNKLLFCLFAVMPVVDSIAGLLHSSFNIGPAYRILIFGYMFILILQYNSKYGAILTITLSAFIIIQTLINIDTAIENIQSTIKLFTPIEMLILKLSEKKPFFSRSFIYKLLDYWSVLYPICIVIPYFIGGNVASYENNVGVKGFFYATNEISFVICVIVMCKFVQFASEAKFKDLCFIIINSICIIIMGTKSGYMTLIVCLILYILFAIRNMYKKKSSRDILRSVLKILTYSIVAISFLWALRDRISPIIDDIFYRWEMASIYTSNSTIDFLSSGRLRRVGNGFDKWLNGKWWYILVGWGFGTMDYLHDNMEMDFLDILFRSGILGTVTVSIYYIVTAIKGKMRIDYWNAGILALTAIIAFFAGHVLFAGASGMALGIILIYCMLRTSDFQAKVE